MKNILIIEDEKDIANLLAHSLQINGFNSLVALDGIKGLEIASSWDPDLILLDLMLPDITGVEICAFLKNNETTSSVPIIITSAKGEEADKVAAFEAGADDYVVKPFSVRELVLRIKAVLRRGDKDNHGNRTIKIDSLIIDTSRHLVTADGKEIILTTIEYKLLINLVEHVGRVRSRDELLRKVQGHARNLDTRTVDTHITRLRAKLGTAGDMIKTIRGFGYKMEEN